MATRKMGLGLKALISTRNREAEKYEQATRVLEDVQTTLKRLQDENRDVSEAIEIFNKAVEPLQKERFDEVMEIAQRAKGVALLSRKVKKKKGSSTSPPKEEVPTLIMLDTAEADRSIFKTRRIIKDLEDAGCDVTQIVYLLYRSLEAFEEGKLDLMKSYALEAEKFSTYMVELELGQPGSEGNVAPPAGAS